MQEKIMSEEAFNEIVDGLEFVEKLTLYGRKNLKCHIKRLQQENQELKLQYCERTDCSGRIRNSKKVEQLQKENQQLKKQLQQKEDIINKAREFIKSKEYVIDLSTFGYNLNDYDVFKLKGILNIDKGDK